MNYFTFFLFLFLADKGVAQVQFTEVTDTCGLVAPAIEDYSYSSTMVDVDNDDWLDLFVAHGNDHFSSFNQLYHNLKDGKFIEITTSAFSTATGAYTGGHCWGDFNNDGFPDLYESHFNATDNKVWQNNGDLTLTEITGRFNSPSFRATGAIWSDIDLDGKLDLLIHTQSGSGSFSFMNRDNSFKDTTILHSRGVGDEILTADINNDDRPDFIFGNAHGIDSIFTSLDVDFKGFSPTFLAAVRDLGDYPGSGTFGDIDEDGYPDLIITYPHKYFVFHNNQGKSFTDWTAKLQLTDAKSKIHLGTFVCDFDNDGWTDIIILNRADTSQLWYGSSNGFRKTNLPINSFKFISGNAIQSLAIGDYDNDGFIDLLHCKQGETHLWHNDGNINRWLNIKLIGHAANYQGMGTKVIAFNQGAVLHWTMGFSQGYYGHIAQIAHFGFGPPSCNTTDIIDSVVIIWQPGGRQVLHNVRMNQLIVVDQDQGIVRRYEKPVSSGMGYVYPLQTPAIHSKPDTTCTVPLYVSLPPALGIDTINVSDISFSFSYDQTMLDISPSKVAQRYSPPTGWTYKSSRFGKDTLEVTITNTAGGSLKDSVYLGSFKFDTYLGIYSSTLLYLNDLVLLSYGRKLSFCSHQEGAVFTRVIVEKDSVKDTTSTSVHSPATVRNYLQMFPNPANGEIRISWDHTASVPKEGILTVYDVLGREIYQSIGRGGLIIPDGKLQNGTYVVEVESNGEKLTGRLIIH